MTLNQTDIARLSPDELEAQFGLDAETAQYLKMVETGGHEDVVGYAEGKFPVPEPQTT
jgi:hypothetical protein